MAFDCLFNHRINFRCGSGEQMNRNRALPRIMVGLATCGRSGSSGGFKDSLTALAPEYSSSLPKPLFYPWFGFPLRNLQFKDNIAAKVYKYTEKCFRQPVYKRVGDSQKYFSASSGNVASIKKSGRCEEWYTRSKPLRYEWVCSRPCEASIGQPTYVDQWGRNTIWSVWASSPLVSWNLVLRPLAKWWRMISKKSLKLRCLRYRKQLVYQALKTPFCREEWPNQQTCRTQ